MVSKLHVISGLPRSGSTLLSALLRQNPRFHAAVTSPVCMLCNTMHQNISSSGEFTLFFTEERKRALLKGVFDNYYHDVPEGDVVFDTSRRWTGSVGLLGALFPHSRVICCVRDIGWILDSIERMLAKNPLELSRIFDFNAGTSVYTRSDILMNHEKGLIGLAWHNLREAWFGENGGRLIIVPYDRLATNPAEVLEKLYAELGEPMFAHDFDHLSYDEPEYDAVLGMPGLHKVREKVERQQRVPCIPPDLFGKYNHAHFWAQELNPRGVRIL